MRRYVILLAAVVMLACLGGGHAWAAFARPLKSSYSLSEFQTQLIWGTSILSFCITMIFAGRLHDRLGPRPLSVACALLMGAAYLLAWSAGEHYFVLWLSMGVMIGLGSAVGYVCPIATVIKWFPGQRGLVAGLSAAGFALGAVAMLALAKWLLACGWFVLDIFGLIGCAYTPAIFLCAMALATPPADGRPATHFPLRMLAGDRRFWMLFVGMLCGTAPYLMVMGNVERIGDWFGLGTVVAAMGVAATAAGNATGRIFWGHTTDRLGHRRAMLAAQSLAVATLAALILAGAYWPAFVVSVVVVGFCYGSNFAIYPASIAKFYGDGRMGSIYPLVMAAQGIASFGPPIGGLLFDWTGSYLPALAMVGFVAVGGLVTTAILGRGAERG